MSLYKIVTNGLEFRVREWIWYWPFWTEINVITSPYSTRTIIFRSKEEAQEWIDLQIAFEKNSARRWENV